LAVRLVKLNIYQNNFENKNINPDAMTIAISVCEATFWLTNKFVVHLLSEGVPSREDTFLSWHLAPVSEVTRGLTLPL
jgi:hypothetical protein